MDRGFVPLRLGLSAACVIPVLLGNCGLACRFDALEHIAKGLPQEETVVGKAGYWAAPNRRPQRDLRYDRGGEARANLFAVCSNYEPGAV